MVKINKITLSKLLTFSLWVLLLTIPISGCQTRINPLDPEIPPLPVNDQESVEPFDVSIFAQNVFKNPELRFEQIGLLQGLSNSTVNVAVQDERGIIWMGTFDGLNKYNGYEFSVFRHNPDDENSLSHNIIYDLYADQHGYLWIGTDAGLNRLDTRSQDFIHYFHTEEKTSLSNDVVNVIIPSADGRLWIGTEGGLDRLDPQSGQFERFINQTDPDQIVLNNFIQALYEDPFGILWIGTPTGLYQFDPQVGEFSDLPGYIESAILEDEISVFTIKPVSDGTLWIGTNHGILEVAPFDSSTKWYRPRELDRTSLSSPIVSSIYEDQFGLIWVGTTYGLNLYYPSRDQFIQFHRNPIDPNSLSGESVNHIIQDRSGVIWFFTNNGVSYVDLTTKQFLHYHNLPNEPNSLINNQVLTILEDSQKFLWIGTFEGLDRLDRRLNHYRHFLHDEADPRSLSDNFITAILEDSNGTLWFGTDNGGINRYNPITEQFDHYKYSPVTTNSISNDSVSALMEDRDGLIWVATIAGLLDRFDPETNTYSHYQLITDDPVSQLKIRIRSMVQDSEGMIWLGTSYGLYRLDPITGESGHFLSNPEDDATLSDDFVLSVYIDSDNEIWIGTYGGGLNHYIKERNRFESFTQRDGLSNDTVYGILEDESGYLWLSTNYGLSRFQPDQKTFENYDARDGLQSNEFNERAYFKSPSGELFFGGINGVTAFFPENIRDNPYRPAVILTSLQTGGRPLVTDQSIETVKEITIAWPDNFFEFSFAGLNYQQPEENQYAYFLQGFDKNWNMNGNLRYGRYTNLPGGDYTLHMVAANEDGVWNTEGIQLAVTVIPPFWERPLFQWTLVVLLVVIAGSAYLLKLRSVQIRNRELEFQVEERTAEIEQRRQVAEGLRDVLVLLNSTQAMDESLNFIVRSANQLTNADHVLLLGIGTDPITYVTVRGSQKREQDDVHSNQEQEEPANFINWLAEIAKTGQSLVVHNLHGYVETNYGNIQLESIQGYESMLVLPILSGNDLFGSMIMFYRTPQKFTEEDLELADSFADQAALAIGNAQLRERVEQMAIVSERNRLARDLHDAVTQTLFSASLLAEALPSLYDKNPDEGKDLLQELRQLSRGALAEMRTLLLELRPSAVIEAKMQDLLRQLAEAATGRTGMDIDLKVNLPQPLPDDVHVSLYRIAQEGLNNVVKHAHATTVKLHLDASFDETGAYKATLIIQDNGRGFDPQNITGDHFGLGIIYERVNSIGALLTMDSQEGNGTLVKVEWQGKAREHD